MTDRTPRPGDQHPDEWREDLNPDANAGQNYGDAGAHATEETRSLADVRELQAAFASLDRDEMRSVPVLAPGTRLRQGATYVDLATPDRQEFTARGDIEAGEGNWFVAKNMVDYQVWNKLIGVDNPERTGEASEA